jgi:AraC family transcriptional activator of mtrCDE
MATDLLSRLLSLMPVSGRLDERCHFGAPWRIEPPGAGPNEIAYHVLLKGSAIVESAHDAPQPMVAGDIVLFPRGAAHALHDGSGQPAGAPSIRHVAGLRVFENDGAGEGADVLCGRFILGSASDQRLLRDYLPQRLVVHGGAAQGDESGGTGTRLSRLVQLMREEALEQGAGSLSLVSHLSAALFALTLRFASESPEPPRGMLALARQPRLQPAVSAMFDSPEQPWDLPKLAGLCHMSRATFARHFETALGRSAFEVLAEIRMTLACRKLVQTDLATAAVGEAVGYASEAAFQRAFKRLIGATPAQWRAETNK